MPGKEFFLITLYSTKLIIPDIDLNYVQVLKQIESKYPGLKELLLHCGLSVQAQETHPVRTAVDQRGEQTINRDAKTSGM